MHLTLQPTELDARVHRAVSTLRTAGADVVLIAPGRGFERRFLTVTRKLAVGLCYGAGARLGVAGARLAFWTFPDHRAAFRAVLITQPDVIHAHDWDALVIGERAARVLDIPLVYDAHEFATEMHIERRLWRWTVAPLIRKLEKAAIRNANAVIVVSDGLAACMQHTYQLEPTPIVVRNIPDQVPAAFVSRPERGDQFLLHYHGTLAQGRGLPEMVGALALLPPRFRLRLTGPWSQRRLKRDLVQTIDKLGLADRVEINRPVPFDALVSHASEADIGFVLLPPNSHHNRFALPNKIGEYIYAALFVVSGNSEEVANLLREHHCGITIGECTPEAIAASLERLSRSEIDQGRAAARVAAGKLRWSDEALRLVHLYNGGGTPVG